MPTFDLVVVGSGGGPYETNLSSYLFKPCDASWKDGVIALEAGSGIGTLHRLLDKDPTLFDKLSAHEVYSLIHCFIISHAHLDHINGLVLSAGSLQGPRKRVCAPLHTLNTLETIFSDRIWPNLASWDADDAAHKLLYDPLKFDHCYRTIFPDVSVKAMPVLHGKNDTLGDYESSAFFIRHDPSAREFLFFGDVSPDSLATTTPTTPTTTATATTTTPPRTLAVWRAAAPKIPAVLSTIFIECSWPSGRPDEQLYGHLSPEHLVDELAALAAEVVAARAAKSSSSSSSNTRTTTETTATATTATTAAAAADDNDTGSASPPLPKRKRRRRNKSADPPPAPLAGLRVYIMHCKEDLEQKYSRPIYHVICDQVKALVQARGLGAEVLSAEQGMTIMI